MRSCAAGERRQVRSRGLEVLPAAATLPEHQEGTAKRIPVGQEITATSIDENDDDYFAFSAVAGSQVTIDLNRVDESLSVFHPDSIDPELILVDPDGLVDAGYGVSDDINGNDTNARIIATLPKSGQWLVRATTTRASGDYTLRVGLTTPQSGGFEVAHLIGSGLGRRVSTLTVSPKS